MRSTMKLSVTRPAALAAAFSAATARVFYALAVESGLVHNGVWLSALLGGLLAAPLFVVLGRSRRSRGPVSPLLTALPGAFALADSALTLSAIARASSFLSMDQADVPRLVLPAALALFWCVSRNGNAVGYAAMLWARIFPALLVLVAMLQWRHYRPGWLLPLLGDGWPAIWKGGLHAAACLTPLVALPMLCEPEPSTPVRGRLPWATIPCGAALAALMLLMRLMMAPTALADGGWIFRLDTLLTNGRAPLYLQLPMIMLWYAGLLHLLACECLVAALSLQRLVPGLDGRLCALLTAGCAAALALSPLSSVFSAWAASAWPLLAMTGLALAVALTSDRSKEGRGTCA